MLARPTMALALVAGLTLLQLAGCAAQLWPPAQWSVAVDLPWVHTPEPVPAPAAAAAPAPAAVAAATAAPLKAPANVAEALAYAQALCALPPAELEAEIERLRSLPVQDGHAPLHAQQLAFAEQLALLYTEQQRLQDANERQAQMLRERQRRIEQLNGQIAAMRAVEYSLPAAAGGAASHGSVTKPVNPAAPRGATSFAVPSTPAVVKALPASTAEPAANRDDAETRVGDDARPTSEP